MAPSRRSGPSNDENPDIVAIITQQLQNIIPQIVTQVTNNVNNANANGRNGGTGGNNGCSYRTFLACNPRDYDGKGGVVSLTRWIKKMELVIKNSGCAKNRKVKYAASSFINKVLTWWNTQVQARGREAAIGGPRNRFAGVLPPNISRLLHGVKLLGGPGSADFDFSSELMMKRVTKSIELMDVVAKINDPPCELLLLRAYVGISKLYFVTHTCPPWVIKRAQCSIDAALRSALERIDTTSGPGFGDWQWRLSTLPSAFGGLGVYSTGDFLNYTFLVSRLQYVGLQTKML
ncbi:hypothetical protein Tco_1471441 [Tanacetum coccineum]